MIEIIQENRNKNKFDREKLAVWHTSKENKVQKKLLFFLSTIIPDFSIFIKFRDSGLIIICIFMDYSLKDGELGRNELCKNDLLQNIN